MGESIEDEYLYWRLAIETDKSLRELDTYSMEEVLILNSLLDMKRDYSIAQQGFDLIKQEKRKK